MHFSPNIIRVMRLAGHVARTGIGEVGYIGGLGGETRGKEKLERPRSRWENNINPFPANVENMVSS